MPGTCPEVWIDKLSRELGIQDMDLTIIREVNESFNNRANTFFSLNEKLEFSFCSSYQIPENTLRYSIKTNGLSLIDVKKIIKTGITLIGCKIVNSVTHLLLKSLEASFLKKENHDLFGVGVEHAQTGYVTSFKTYWKSKLPPTELGLALTCPQKDMFENLLAMIPDYWPRWRNPSLIGIDMLCTREYKIKIYFPEKTFRESLSLITFGAFLRNLGWNTDPDSLAKIGYFLLNGNNEIFPSAYSIGFTLSNNPAVKLYIPTKAYYNHSEEALNALLHLTQSLNLKSIPIIKCYKSLRKFNPFNRIPNIEVIGIDFYPNDKYRVNMYCTL